MVAVVFLCQITVFYNKTHQHHFWNYFNDPMQTVYARDGGGGGCGSRQREVADGADVVFTDTAKCKPYRPPCLLNCMVASH